MVTMEKFATENLVLLEFLVESVTFDYSERKDLQVMNGETLVSFQFLDNAPLLVTEEEFMPKCREMCPSAATNNVKHGKSCLFSLTPAQAENALDKFDIYVEIYKKMKPGMLPEKVKIGESLISIVNIFSDLMDAIIKRQETTTAKVMKDTFKIMNLGGQAIGKIKVFVRISCFGKLIVTQFQMDLESKSVEFKAKEGHYMFKYDKKDGRCPAELCPTDRDLNQLSTLSQESCSCAEENSPSAPTCCKSSTFYPPPACPAPSEYCTPPTCYPYCPPPTCCIKPTCFPTRTCCFTPPSCPYLPPCIAPPCSPTILDSSRRPNSAPVQNSRCMTPCEIYQLHKAAAKPPPSESSAVQYSREDKFQEIGASMGKNAVTIRVRKQANAKVEPWNGECDLQEEKHEDDNNCPFENERKKRCRISSAACPSSSFDKSHKSISTPGCCYCKPPVCTSQSSTDQMCCAPECLPPSCYPLQCPPPSYCPMQCAPIICFPSQCHSPPNGCLPEPPGTCNTNTPSRKLLTYPQCPPVPACCYSSPCCQYPCIPTSNPLVEKKCTDDPDKETFVLKIGKKNEGSCCKQNDLELEVCTPKGKEIKPPPQKQCRDAQYSLLDIPDEYLEAFYGKDKWKKMKKEQEEEEAKLNKLYGAYGFGEGGADKDNGAGKKKNGKGYSNGKGGGKDGKGGGRGEGRGGGGGDGKGRSRGRGAGDSKARSGGGAGVFIERQIYIPCDPCNPCKPCTPCRPCPPCDPCKAYRCTSASTCYR